MQNLVFGVILAVICSAAICKADDTVTSSFTYESDGQSCTAGECATGNKQPKVLTFKAVSSVIGHIKDVITIANSKNVQATESVLNLERLIRNLESGKIKAGVVGLTNSGKSTFLNAILGRQYLPSSVQSQTAKEVSIIHTPESPGELVAIGMDTDSQETIASGWEAINAKLTELNTEIRDENSTYRRLSLNAPILLLNGIDTVKMEISDTPGLYEAAAHNITHESELAVREMSAFVMILNLRLLKLESEAAIIKALITNHPTLFAKLSRIIILVNAYDVAFLDDNPDSLKPDAITTYVADYLQDPKIIGIEIPPEQIIPFSAKWALNARVWSANPAAFLKMKHAKLLYDEAVILMRRATNYESEIVPFEEASVEDIEHLCTFLLDFSHIHLIEEKLRSMLYENGPFILIEASIDDSIAQIKAVLDIISNKIAALNLAEKTSHLTCHENLLTRFNELESRQAVQAQGAPTSEINSITETLRGTLSTKLSSIFQNHMVGFHLHQDRNAVFNRMCSAKPLLTSPANTEIQASWGSVSGVVHQKSIEHARSSVSSIKTTFLEGLTSFAKDNPTCGKLALELSSKLSNAIDQINTNSLVPGFPRLQLQVDGNSVSNNRLNHILTSYEVKWKTSEFRKKRRGGWFGRSRRKIYYSSTSYQSSVFSPDIGAVQNVLLADAVNPWVTSFRSSVDSTIASMSNQLVQKITAAKTTALSAVKAELGKAVDNSRQMLEVSRNAVDQFNKNKEDLLKIQDSLKEFSV